MNFTKQELQELLRGLENIDSGARDEFSYVLETKLEEALAKL